MIIIHYDADELLPKLPNPEDLTELEEDLVLTEDLLFVDDLGETLDVETGLVDAAGICAGLETVLPLLSV